MSDQHKRKPTLTDVAREAHVGIMTVSRVVNGGSYVGAATEKRVRAAIRKLGYQPNEAARMLKGQRARMIGLIVPDLADPFYSTCANAVQEVAGKHGYMTIVLASQREVSLEAQEIEMMVARNIAGLVIVPCHVDSQTELQRVRSNNIPIVMLDRTLSGLSAGEVTVENRAGARLAVHHLIEHGHTNILCLGYDTEFDTISERILGYTNAMQEAGLKPQVLAMETREVIEPVLQKRLLAPNRPTALFALNNVTAVATLQTLRKEGLHVPKDVALIGFDDFSLASLLSVPLTTVRQPVEDIGREGTRLLFDSIQGGADFARPLTTRVILPTELIIRESCGCKTVAKKNS